MDWLQVGLRVVHIATGIAWVGGAALFFFYIEPTMNKLGPDAEKFVDELVNKRKLPVYFITVSTVAVVVGFWLYWRYTGGLQPSAVGATSSLVFLAGGVASLFAWAGGNLLIPRTLRRVAAIGSEMKAVGGPPSAELLGRMHAAQQRLRRIGLIDLVLLGLAVLAMASARYLA